MLLIIVVWGGGTHSISQTNYILKPTATTIYTINAYTGYYGPGCGSTQTFTLSLNPDKPIITQKSDTLISSASINNQWFLNGNIISGATGQTHIASVPGTYAVKVTGNGCGNYSDDLTYAPDSNVYTRNAWQKMIRGGKWSQGTCVVEAHDSGFVIGSNCFSTGRGNDIALVKTDRQGEVIWSKTYGSNEEDNISSIIKVASGYMAVGSTKGFGKGSLDVYLLAFDNNGSLLWSKTYGDWNNQEGVSIEQTSDGGYIITGYSSNPNTYGVDQGGWVIDENDLYLLKTDINGNLLWSKVFDTASNEIGVEAHETKNGDYIVAGRSTDSQSKESVYTLKTDATGNLLWSRMIANSFFAETTSMKITTDNNYLFCTGASGSTYLLKLDTNGNVLWSEIAHVNNWGSSLIATDDSAAVFTSGFGYLDGTLTKIDNNGNLLWSSTFTTGMYQYAAKVIQLTDKTFLITGAIDTTGSYQPGQINLINTDITGLINCGQLVFPSITNETYSYTPHTTLSAPLGTVMNASPNLYTGSFQSSTICKSLTAVHPVDKQKENLPFIVKVYPNPTDGVVNIEFFSALSESRVRILDVCGRCVYDKNSSGNLFYQADVGYNNKGVYLVEVTTGDKRLVKKIVLH